MSSRMVKWENLVTGKTGVVPEKTWDRMKNHPLARGRYRKLDEFFEKEPHYIADSVEAQEEEE